MLQPLNCIVKVIAGRLSSHPVIFQRLFSSFEAFTMAVIKLESFEIKLRRVTSRFSRDYTSSTLK